MTTYKIVKKLDDKYNASEIEKRCIDFWEKDKTYQFDKTALRENTYVVDTPPPTVSGSLHIGHIMSYTQTDVTVRYQRMKGKSIFYPIGWDDNGLPTERRVQNYFNITCNPDLAYDPNFHPIHNPKGDEKRREVSRKNFIEACEVLTKEDEKAFEDVFRRIGYSYDWSLKYTTISPESIRISQESFLDLAEKGMVYSAESPTMWDVTLQSAVAQAEIEDRKIDGFFHEIRFEVEGESDYLKIATTRPEFLPACIAVVAHPNDVRYQKYFGKKAIVPLFDIPVPIIPSEHAEMDKGTGIMIVCTFGDTADVGFWRGSGLPIKQILGMDGRILKSEDERYPYESLNSEKATLYYKQITGLKVKDARIKIVDLLRESGDLLSNPIAIEHPVKFYEKGTLPLEFITNRQWFIKILDYKKELIEAGQKIKWFPEYMQKRYETWVEGLNQEWCISRQRFFGVPFPIWYKLDKKGEINYKEPIFARKEQLPVDPMSDVPNGYTEDMRGCPDGFIGEKDIMDTWATSSVTPQIALAHAPKGHHLSLPFDVRPQAHDIIRTWAFYTIMKALANEGKIPWKEAHISGFVLDPERKKMSKSKGNVMTPMPLLEEYSSDAVRYWGARAKLGIDLIFKKEVMDQGKKLTIKLFNAARFVYTMVQNAGLEKTIDYRKNITHPLDKSWISKLKETVESSVKAFEINDSSFALEITEKCFWDFCDNYLEIVKGRAYVKEGNSAVSCLMWSIDTFCKLFAPFLPFITEEIYQTRPWGIEEKSIHKMLFPSSAEYEDFSEDISLYEKTVSLVEMVRKKKAEEKHSLRTPVVALTISGNQKTLELLKKAIKDIENVLNVKENSIVFEPHSEELFITNCVLGENEKNLTNN